jgi:hypothetical protein
MFFCYNCVTHLRFQKSHKNSYVLRNFSPPLRVWRFGWYLVSVIWRHDCLTIWRSDDLTIWKPDDVGYCDLANRWFDDFMTCGLRFYVIYESMKLANVRSQRARLAIVPPSRQRETPITNHHSFSTAARRLYWILHTATVSHWLRSRAGRAVLSAYVL